MRGKTLIIAMQLGACSTVQPTGHRGTPTGPEATVVGEGASQAMVNALQLVDDGSAAWQGTLHCGLGSLCALTVVDGQETREIKTGEDLNAALWNKVREQRPEVKNEKSVLAEFSCETTDGVTCVVTKIRLPQEVFDVGPDIDEIAMVLGAPSDAKMVSGTLFFEAANGSLQCSIRRLGVPEKHRYATISADSCETFSKRARAKSVSLTCWRRTSASEAATCRWKA